MDRNKKPKKTKKAVRRVVKVKAWAVIRDGALLPSFNFIHNVFAPRIYNTAESARNVARRLEYETEIVQVEISYSLPPLTKKR